MFIDWQVAIDPDRDNTALQMLWRWALTSAGVVLTSAGHADAARWTTLAARLRETLVERAWSPSTRTCREYLDDSPTDSPYANLFAVLAEVAPEFVGSEIVHVLRDGPRVRTPFVAAFALDALVRAGDPDAAIAQIRHRWGR